MKMIFTREERLCRNLVHLKKTTVIASLLIQAGFCGTIDSRVPVPNYLCNKAINVAIGLYRQSGNIRG